MSRFRDIKRAARRDLHDELQVPALYLAPDQLGGPGLPVSVRVHDKSILQGDIDGGAYAERRSSSLRIIMLVEQVASPARGAVISIEAGEAYAIDHSDDADDITITAYVTRLSAAEAAGLPVPA
jgi:hypothetical protein